MCTLSVQKQNQNGHLFKAEFSKSMNSLVCFNSKANILFASVAKNDKWIKLSKKSPEGKRSGENRAYALTHVREMILDFLNLSEINYSKLRL